jgi:glutamine amidotransferase
VVLDYGSGNVHSAVKALESVGARVSLTADRAAVQAADGLLVPGVGAFASVMSGLTAERGHELIDRRVAGGRSVLGICVGFPVLFERGQEGETTTDGLGEWPGVVERLDAPVLPHMGWDEVRPPQGSQLFAGIEDERFYFVHSYGVREWAMDSAGTRLAPPLVTWSDHGGPFIAAVENGPLAATQFHPEKSGAAGLRLLSNWLETL